MTKFSKLFSVMLIMLMTGISFSSCSKDDGDEPKTVNIVGKWEYMETYEDENVTESIKMVLTFNNDRTGSIEENWVYESRASSVENYKMNFSWATSTDSNGNEILKISYVSGDKVTELFPGESTTVLWTRQFVLTGNILNIYGGDGVWVFNRK